MEQLFSVKVCVHDVELQEVGPNTMVEWLITLLRSWEAPGSNLSLETGYPDLGFCGFPQFLQVNAGIVPKIRPRPLLSTSFPIHNSLTTILFDAV
jgi:hypothetical protein